MTPETKERTVDVRTVINIVLKRKWLLILPLVLVSVVAYVASYFLTPVYSSSTIIWIDRPYNVSHELINLIGREAVQRTSEDDRRRELQALQNEITSQAYLSRLIQDLGLDNNPEVARQAAQMRERNPELSLQEMKYRLVSDQLRKHITVSFVGQDQIRLTVESTDPTQARDMVTRLTEILEQEKTAYEMQKILDNQTFADEQLQRTEHEYQQTQDSLTDAQLRLTTLQLPETIASEDNRREILSDIDNAKLEITDFNTELTTLGNQLEQFGVKDARLRYTDSLVDLRAQIDAQVANFASMMEKYSWSSQNVINVNIRLNDNVRLLEREITRAADRQFASYPENQRQLLGRYFVVQENLDILNSKVSQLQLWLNKIDNRMAAVPRLQAEIAELDRRVTEARRYRDAFRSEESTVEILSDRAKDRTQYKIIEPARVPLVPVWPDRRKITVMGVLLGIILGGAAVFLAEIVDNSFKTVEDVEMVLQLPVLAAIPRIDKLHINR